MHKQNQKLNKENPKSKLVPSCLSFLRSIYKKQDFDVIVT